MPPSALLAELARSFLDLWHHVDGVEARRFDREGPFPRLRPFDREISRGHVAALRSIEGATVELEVTELDDEIDRTILLAAIRPQIRRHEHEHPERTNPTFWTGRLVAALEATAGDAEVLASVPPWVEAARATVANPPLAALPVAHEDVAAARTTLARSEWWQADQEALSQSVAALDRLDRFLRLETMPDPTAEAGALGEPGVSWHLHHAALIETGAEEAARRLRYQGEMLRPRVESLGSAPGPGLDLRGVAAAYGQGLRHQESEIRRRVVPPAWLEGFALFAAGAVPETDPRRPVALAAVAERIQLARVDLEVQLAQQEVGKALAAPLGAAVVRHPLETAVTALLALEWETLRVGPTGDATPIVAAVVEHGVIHPALARWRLGFG